MAKFHRILGGIVLGLIISSCSLLKPHGSTKVLKPKTHKIWARGNRYLIDIPVGNRHIRMFERKRTKIARMK